MENTNEDQHQEDSLASFETNDWIRHRSIVLSAYDLIILRVSWRTVLFINPYNDVMSSRVGRIEHFILMAIILMTCRYIGGAYRQVWRYSRHRSYLRLIGCDVIAGGVYWIAAIAAERFVPGFGRPWITRIAEVCMVDLLGVMTLRFLYTLLYEAGGQGEIRGRHVRAFLKLVTGVDFNKRSGMVETNRIRVAIIGAGRIGTTLAADLFRNPESVYIPVCFVDVSQAKIGRKIMELPVLEEGEDTKTALSKLDVQEVVIAIQDAKDKQHDLYNRYKDMGLKVKVYSFPLEDTEEKGKRQIREFDIQELLFRDEKSYLTEETKAFYRDQVVLVSGGGGSIGSELSRQIAKAAPKQLILLDIYENNLYDIQQELRMNYGASLNLAVEVASVRDVKQLDKVFRTYHPDIVLHAAAHKHVPLMEHNCSEAVKNNVFGTYNMVNVSKKYGVKKFVMVSTDKAVNPTNVMGATKRMCEMIVLSNAAGKNGAEGSNTSFSCTRFGNVLGSNGSVIPLFKRQIAKGGPVTLTDKRIIRYFMTIPEASQLVLTSGAMAKNGELFVLDMGRPIKILDLAENMIRLCGLVPYRDIEIVETGLRPGEKLYEELLIKSETLAKTENEMIFVEKDEPVAPEAIETKLNILKNALATEDDDRIREAMKGVVPTFKEPEMVNARAAGIMQEQTLGIVDEETA